MSTLQCVQDAPRESPSTVSRSDNGLVAQSVSNLTPEGSTSPQNIDTPSELVFDQNDVMLTAQ